MSENKKGVCDSCGEYSTNLVDGFCDKVTCRKFRSKVNIEDLDRVFGKEKKPTNFSDPLD